MSRSGFSWQRFSKVPLIGIIRNLTFDEVKEVLPIYVEAGLTSIEITLNTPLAETIIRYTLDHYGNNLNVGAGTVCSMKDLNDALSAGAQFIITPILDKKVIGKCVKEAIPVFPGAFTPSEIYTAWKLGAPMIKIYPATSLGPEYIRDVKAPLNKVKLLPTGGINLHNLPAFIKAGADGLGVGSQLFNEEYIKNKNWAGLKSHFEEYVKYCTTSISEKLKKIDEVHK
jgi:2-dehydro-3-deoxyphosphogluconate aldolase/(4S)-4-hydroxy-2-oxoglutarate aldolase